MKKLIVTLFAIALAGCGTTKLMNGIMSSWDGATLDEVVQQWGYPTSVQDFRGNKLYRWEYTKSAYIPQTTTVNATSYQTGAITNFNGTATTAGGHTFSGSCTRILEVNPQGIVIHWQWEGNNCPFWEAMEYKTWRNKAKTQ